MVDTLRRAGYWNLMLLSSGDSLISEFNCISRAVIRRCYTHLLYYRFTAPDSILYLFSIVILLFGHQVWFVAHSTTCI